MIIYEEIGMRREDIREEMIDEMEKVNRRISKVLDERVKESGMKMERERNLIEIIEKEGI